MPQLPGIVDGQKVEDKRVAIMTGVLIRYYQHTLDKWDDITDVRSRITDLGETVTVRLGPIKHTWKFVKQRNKHTGHWALVKQERVYK